MQFTSSLWRPRGVSILAALAFLSLWSVCAVPSLGQIGGVSSLNPETRFVVLPGTTSHAVALPPGAVVNTFEEPLHGTLVHTGQGFDYLPSASFWDVGNDAFIVDLLFPLIGSSSTYRYSFTAGALALDTNAVFSNTIDDPSISTLPWEKHHAGANKVVEVPGIVADIAYAITIDSQNSIQPSLKVPDDGTAGHQGAAEHRVDVSVDDLGTIGGITGTSQEFPFYRVSQNNQTLIQINAFFSDGGWFVRPETPGPQTMAPIAVDIGLHRMKLVRWHNPGGQGADFYINDHLIGTLTDLPVLTLSPVSHEILVASTDEYDDLVMRFEDPLLVTGGSFVEGSERLIYDGFPGTTFTGSSVWDQVVGAAHMNTSPQTLAGSGQQLDIDMGSVPHWQHAYLRQDYLAAPLSRFNTRFWMDPSLLNMPEGGSVRLVYGCTNSAANYCVDFRLGLTKTNGGLELNLYSWEDDGTLHTVSTPIAQGPQFVEIRYQTAVAPGVPTGWAQLWVDGTLVGTSDHLDNFNRKVEDVRIGSNYTAGSITGILSLDEIETWAY